MLRNKSQYYIDSYIVFAVGIQSFLLILQHCLLAIFQINEETATSLRVAMTVATMMPAIIFSAYRRFSLFFITYFVALIILLSTITIFPSNKPFIYREAFRFLLPVSFPCCLCLTTIRDYTILKNALYIISIATSILIFIYCIAYFRGSFVFYGYSMSFGYGCLLPMAILYSKENTISRIISFIILLVVFSIGSRGAALVFILYVIIDVLLFDRRKLPFLCCIGFIAILMIPVFFTFLDKIDINSRTLSLLLQGDFFNYDSGRSDIYAKIYSLIIAEPFGHGVYGDRVALDGMYSHNFFLEILFDFGIIGGFLIFVFLGGWILSVYVKINKEKKRMLIQFIIVLLAPLMVSNSLLKDYNFGLLLGIIIVLNKNNNYSVSGGQGKYQEN